MPLISFVIPVYNVEKYLCQCVESILSQSFEEFEIILVNDGSKDRSGDICDEYALKDKRVKVIHKPNGGLSDARNAGVPAAVGEYIIFIDSDDYIKENTLSVIAERLLSTKADVIFLESVKVFSDGTEKSLGSGFTHAAFDGVTGKAALEAISKLPKFPAAAWGKAVRREIIVNNGLRFEKGLLSEDLDYAIGLFLASDKYDYCDIPFYCYRKGRSDSITANIGDKNVESQLYILEKWSANDAVPSEYKPYVFAWLSYIYTVAVTYLQNTTGSARSGFVRRFKDLSFVLDYAVCQKAKMSRKLVSVLGVRLTSLIFAIYLKVR